MTRINTNVSSMMAQQNLAKSNDELNTTLTRLSTGLKINTGADDPSGLIAAAALGSEITSTNQAISNSQQANQMISTADSALGQISSLLENVRGLVTQAANTSTMSSDEISANQSQIDSSLNAIDQIAQTTTFQGNQLLDGSMGFSVAQGQNYSEVQNLQVNQANFGASNSMAVNINVQSVAKQASITDTINGGTGTNATATLGFQDGGSVSITAPTTGTSTNGVTVQVLENSSIAAGTAKASYDADSQTLTVNVSNQAGTTSATTIANAISTGTSFTATASSALGTVGYVHGTDTPTGTAASYTMTTADGGELQITSLTPGASMNGKTVTMATTGTAATQTALNSGISVDGSGNLTITADDSTHNVAGNGTTAGQTSLASLATAINTYTNGGGDQVFQATVLKAGNVDSTVNNVGTIDGGTTSAGSASAVTVALDATHSFTLTADRNGSDLGNAAVKVVLGGAGVVTTSATWDSTYNTGGANGQLVITLAHNANLSAGDVATAVTNATVLNGGTANPFAVTTDSTTGFGTTLYATSNSTTSAGAFTVNGLSSTLQGGGVGTTFASGTGTSGLAAALVVQIGGNLGNQTFNFIAGTTASEMATTIAAASTATGVTATHSGDLLQLSSTDYGKKGTIAVNVISEGAGGTFGSSTNLSGTSAQGQDMVATINNMSATSDGDTVSLDTPTLSMSADLNPATVSNGDTVGFTISGGALFQLGAEVTSAQQARLGFQDVGTASLGGTSGRLYELGAGQDASLSNNSALASQIIDQAESAVTTLRSRLGAFQQATVDTNINALTDAVTNLTSAQSSIQDADFAAESANLTRAQILVQSGTSVLSIANKNPQNVLSLVQNA